LFEFVINTFKRAKGRKLTSLEVHDIMCMIGEVVVVGGVRRSALISLSNLSDLRMRDAKSGAWYIDNPHRSLANNSVAYTEKPDAETFMEEWLSLVKSKSGERGIFNRKASQNQAAKWGRRSSSLNYGTNP
jgi:ribonucleoside-diphosphate reductase alpha chain